MAKNQPTPTPTNPSNKRLKAGAVRTCSADCPFIKFSKRGEGKGCEYFQRKEVRYGQPCLYDINMIDGFVQAHNTGDMGFVKETVGSMVGAMMVRLFEMIHLINEEGMTRKEPILDGKGMPIVVEGEVMMKIVEHPLLTKVTQISKAIGFDLSKFNLTPSSADEKPTVQGNIMLSTGSANIEVVLAENRKSIDEFEKAASRADKRLEEDRVYNQMKGDQG